MKKHFDPFCGVTNMPHTVCAAILDKKKNSLDTKYIFDGILTIEVEKLWQSLSF